MNLSRAERFPGVKSLVPLYWVRASAAGQTVDRWFPVSIPLAQFAMACRALGLQDLTWTGEFTATVWEPYSGQDVALELHQSE